MIAKDIFDFVSTEENSFKVTPIQVADGFEWSMPEHIRRCILVKDGKLLSGEDDMKPVKNIVLPILNVSYRSEGFDVKDIEPYVDNPDNYHKSFLVRKFHEKYALENQLDTFIDDVVESYVDFGGVLVKNVKTRPEVVPLQTLAFCDQTDILSGPFAIKHQYSVDQLNEKKGIWNDEAIDEVIKYARYEKPNAQTNGQNSKTPGKYIEVYEVHGVFPKSWLTKDTSDYFDRDDEEYSRQLHIICFNTSNDNVKKGICLFKGKEADGLFKMLKRDKRYGTALGRSAIEELFEAQVWTNYSLIQKRAILDKLAMMLGITDDPSFSTKNKFTDLEQGEWLIKAPNTSVEPFIFPANNLNAFDGFTQEMEQHARTTGSASDPQLGLNPVSGTPLGTTQIVTAQGVGIHEYRQGKIAAFIEEIYRDWILPKLVTQMNKGSKFMAELSLEELNEVADKVATNTANTIMKEKILNGQMITPEEQTILIDTLKNSYLKGGTKRFHEIMKDELSSIPIDVRVNVAGKQKNLAAYADKLSNIIRAVVSNPLVLQDPNVSKLLNADLEASGISPIAFVNTPQQPVQSPMQMQGAPLPITK